MKTIQELVQMSVVQRQNYLEQHQSEFTIEWAEKEKDENNKLAYDDPQKGIEAGKIILQAAQTGDIPKSIAIALWAQGNAYMLADFPREANHCFEQASIFFNEINDRINAARIDVVRIATETDLGHLDRAINIALEIRPILAGLEGKQNRKNLAMLELNLGIAVERRGDYEDALAISERGLQIIQEFLPDDIASEIRLEQNRALALAKLKRFPEAIEVSLKVIEVFEKHNVISDAIRAWLGLGHLYTQTGREKEALTAFDNARNWLSKLSDKDSLQNADLTLRLLYLKSKESPIDVVQQASQLREKYADRAFLPAQKTALLEAEARLQMGDTSGVRNVCTEVMEALSGRNFADLLWQAVHLTGRAWEQEDELEKARESYKTAVTLIEKEQRQIKDIELRASTLSGKLAVYQDLVALLIQSREYEAAFQTIERSKSRVLVEGIQERLTEILSPDQGETLETEKPLKELQELRIDLDQLYQVQKQTSNDDNTRKIIDVSDNVEKLENEYAAKARELGQMDARYSVSLGTYKAKISDVRASLNGSSLLLEYYIIRDVLHVLCLPPQGELVHYSLGKINDIQELIAHLHEQLNGTDEAETPDVQNWEVLYAFLIEPLESILDGIEQLLIIPDGILYYLSFQALLCKETGRRLIEDYEIRYAPGITSLVLAKKDRPVKENLTLALGYGGGHLAYVASEMGALAATLPGLILLTGEEASRKRLKKFAPEANVIHIAAHGDFRPDAPLFSFIALADGRWQVADIYNQRINASLVTLGACRTGIGKIAGSDLIGFTHALFYAGAQATLVSLWPVDDASTAMFMSTMYQGLNRGETKAAAVRRAQLALLHSEQWNDPRYWAPFCLMGNDGVVNVLGLMKTIRQIVEQDSLSLAGNKNLFEQFRRSVDIYSQSEDEKHLSNELIAVTNAFPDLRNALRTKFNTLPDLSQTGYESNKHLLRFSFEVADDIDDGVKVLGKTSTEKASIHNETIKVLDYWEYTKTKKSDNSE